MKINKLIALQIAVVSSLVILYSASLLQTREYKTVPVNELHQALNLQFASDLSAVNNSGSKLLTAQRQSRGKSDDNNSREQVASYEKVVSRIPLSDEDATRSFIDNRLYWKPRSRC